MAPRQQQQTDDGYDEDDPGELGDFLDEHHANIVTFANEYLDEDEREGFIDGLMERRGYVRTQSWGPPADKGPARRPVLPDRGSGGQGKHGKGGRPPYFKR